jgi:hypothetical protein
VDVVEVEERAAHAAEEEVARLPESHPRSRRRRASPRRRVEGERETGEIFSFVFSVSVDR